MELAEKKGLGDVIKKLFEEAGLGKTMADPDYTCFDRLYDDALRRMDKQRRLEWYRLGNTGEPPPSFKAKHAYRRRSPDPQDSKRVYTRNCGAAVKVSLPSGPSVPATRSPSPYDRFDSAASTYYQPGNTLQHSYSSGSLHSQRSVSPSRSLSPSASAFDLRIESVRPGKGGHIALSGLQGLQGQSFSGGKLRGAMFVQELRPAECTGEDPRMMWRPQKSLPLDAPGDYAWADAGTKVKVYIDCALADSAEAASATFDTRSFLLDIPGEPRRKLKVDKLAADIKPDESKVRVEVAKGRVTVVLAKKCDSLWRSLVLQK
eukprot:g3133.t1